ncbi:MAG: TIGR02206 family membrane protein [Clostridia bacterium]|nr:TIGR02206 family membrane protein [Clostridia bacterium]
MQFVLLAFWLLATALMARRGLYRAGCALLCGMLAVSMGTQLWILGLNGLLSVDTALPLHLCSFSAVLALPMLLFKSQRLLAFELYLGAPGALLALCFPAMLQCEQQFWMAVSFYQLHALIVCAPLLLLWSHPQPMPDDPRSTLVLGNAYLLLVSLFNRLFGTNYLFLRRAPLGTPLALWFDQGYGVYIFALEMAAMLLFTLLSVLYARLRYCRKYAAT